MDIDLRLMTSPKKKPDYGTDQVPFGQLFTDHMFLLNYDNSEWSNARIVPYGEILLSPAANSLHYGMAIFEGMKAYRSPKGETLLFRPYENARRFNESAYRMCMPDIPQDVFVKSVARLVEVDRDWIPTVEGMSLYIRPFMFAIDPMVNVTLPNKFLYSVILSPVGLISGGKPIRLVVEEEYVRAAPGGTGAAKTAGNYAGAMRAVTNAKAKGYDQVLWLDAVERKHIEEVSAMNIFFVVGDRIVTPETSGTILEGITRASVVEMMRDWGMDVQERKVSIDELVSAHKAGELKEAFCVGTAAVVVPVGHIGYRDYGMDLPQTEVGKRVYDELVGIQTGTLEDKRGWTYKVC